MEKAKRYVDKQNKSSRQKTVKKVLLLLVSIIVACGVIFGALFVNAKKSIYDKISSVRDWEVPPETEVVGFEANEINPLRWCDEVCAYTSRLYLASNLSITDLEDFYRHLSFDLPVAHIGVTKSDNLHTDDRPIYILWVRWLI